MRNRITKYTLFSLAVREESCAFKTKLEKVEETQEVSGFRRGGESECSLICINMKMKLYPFLWKQNARRLAKDTKERGTGLCKKKLNSRELYADAVMIHGVQEKYQKLD